MRNAKGENIIARINLGQCNHQFELAETPKGMLEARIDGDPISSTQLRELNDWLAMIRRPSRQKDDQ